MRLVRVQVPEFRALKNIDIAFERDFFPSIFPLGGQNVGANSAFLQFIFILLYCSCDPERTEFIQNLLDNFDFESDEKKLAIFEIWDGEKIVNIEFSSCKYSFFKRSLDFTKLTDKQSKALLDNHWPSTAEKADLEKRIRFLNADLVVLEQIEERTKNIAQLPDRDRARKIIRQELDACNELFFRKMQYVSFPDNEYYFEEFKRDFHEEIVYLSRRIKEVLLDLQSTQKRYSDRLQIITEQFNSRQQYFIIDYKEEKEKCLFFCRSTGIEYELLEDFLLEMSSQIYFASPPSKIFLFINKEIRKNIFSQDPNGNSDRDYALAFNHAKVHLPRFFTYDLFPLDLLDEYLRHARERDHEQTIEVEPYSDRLIELMDKIEALSSYETMSFEVNFPETILSVNSEINLRELAELDKIYGEWARLNIYLWLKYRNIENSIVLIDEIENGLPTEWQDKIVEDLQQWQPSNQYILVTYSRELRQALPPEHYKPIEPKRTHFDDWSETAEEAIDF